MKEINLKEMSDDQILDIIYQASTDPKAKQFVIDHILKNVPKHVHQPILDFIDKLSDPDYDGQNNGEELFKNIDDAALDHYNQTKDPKDIEILEVSNHAKKAI